MKSTVTYTVRKVPTSVERVTVELTINTTWPASQNFLKIYIMKIALVKVDREFQNNL